MWKRERKGDDAVDVSRETHISARDQMKSVGSSFYALLVD